MSLRKTRLDGLAGLVTLPIPTETASPDLRPTPLANKRQRWFDVSPPSFESALPFEQTRRKKSAQPPVIGGWRVIMKNCAKALIYCL
jgi:hypothetical protein